MSPSIDFILVFAPHNKHFAQLVKELVDAPYIHHLFLVANEGQQEETKAYESDRCSVLLSDSCTSSKFLRMVAQKVEAPYSMLYLSGHDLCLGYRAAERMVQAAEALSPTDSPALMVYADHYDGEGLHPLIDYQEGALRNDFDFGSLWLIRTQGLKDWCRTDRKSRFRHAAPYALRLYISAHGKVLHLPEPLYTETETDLRASGVKQFDYVNPAAREVQLEMERACTQHLKQIGAWLAPDEYDELPVCTTDFPVEASVIIPVRNRIKTIADAVRSALEQETDFPFNVIVVDNHSTDGTGSAVRETFDDERVILLQPERTDLGIGGCWDMAIRHEKCGKYAVQLDSDDLYSSPHALQRIVDAFGKQSAAMVIGSYRMVNFKLETLPPGLIAHSEWTPENGRNNALRINGLGAPRAFRTDLLREMGFPNTSYGEDYALGLAFSRRYRIGRIYDELYLCRRWEGNSDAALDIIRQNKNNLYKDFIRTIELHARQQMITRWNHRPDQAEADAFFAAQLEVWDEVRQRYDDLYATVQTRQLPLEEGDLNVQYNPSRIVSTGAKIDKANIRKRPCFLCNHNRPTEQIDMPCMGSLQLLVNPFPILPKHYTLPTRRHVPQVYAHLASAIDRLAWNLPDSIVFYNGARSGASAPDHAHLQAGSKGVVPIERDWHIYENRMERIYPSCKQEEADLEEQGYNPHTSGIFMLRGYACPAFVIQGPPQGDTPILLNKLMSVLPVDEKRPEPDVNILTWRQQGGPSADDYIVTIVFVRKKHRPDCYHAKGKGQYLISPGAIDMGGLIITPRKEDFERLTPRMAQSILREVTLSETEMNAIARKLHGRRRNPASAHAETPVGTDLHALLAGRDISVGILHAPKVSFTLNGRFMAKGEVVEAEQTVECMDGGIKWNGNIYSELLFEPEDDSACTFTLHEVSIGVDFHWEQKEAQTFKGCLRFVVDEEKLVAINMLPVEEYLVSVISSEMSASSSIELLKSHAVISRSWVYSQMLNRLQHKGEQGGFFNFIRKNDEVVKWHDRTDHTLYDVCADDHCQRYQGITRASLPQVKQAVLETAGQILIYDHNICDARFSKCCGGITERYSACWDDTDFAYLQPVSDRAEEPASELPDLTDEKQAEQWIRTAPESFCNTHDTALLSQVLNHYDRQTEDFYRWRVELTQEEARRLIEERTEMEFGDIMDLVPVERGASGRIVRLRIVGTRRELIIGKELEIRRLLSTSHLYSSAFVVDKAETDAMTHVPGRFILTGAGWGHGVGLCQIGAAVMADKGYNYRQILSHYYKESAISEI